MTYIKILSARLGSTDFAREMPDFTNKIGIPGIFGLGTLGG
jgi:hypothetical protein